MPDLFAQAMQEHMQTEASLAARMQLHNLVKKIGQLLSPD